MKKLALPILMTIALLFTGAIIFSGCTKEGPQGPAGANGADGNETCGQCHDLSAKLIAIIGQYEKSYHAIGPDHERNGTSCAPCHTHQGFLEVLQTGANVTAAVIDNPAHINCRTCHKIHSTYTAADYALRITSPVTMLIHGDVVDFGKGNMCAKCHQGRPFSTGQEPNPNQLTDTINITSSRYGVHHAPHANLLAGKGAFEIAGSMSYTTGPLAHVNQVENGCVSCHMAEAFGYQAGGHSWWMKYDYHGATEDHVAACLDCHADIEEFDVNGFMTEIKELHDSLGNKLIAIGILKPSLSTTTGKWTALHAGAMWNHQMIREDRSWGVHNPAYIKALLVNTLEAL